MASTKISINTRQNLFLVFFSLIYFSLSLPVNYAGLDLDASWHQALAMAIDKNFAFGRDFIFNYGPLGYMNTGLLPKSVSPVVLLAISLFELFNYLAIIRIAFAKSDKKWWVVAVSAILIIMPWGFIADKSFTLFYFLLFWLLHAQKTRNTIGLLISVLLSVLIFYIKLNLSIVVYVVMVTSLIYFYFARYFTLQTIILVVVVLVGLTWSLSFVFNVDLPGYLGSSIQIIDAYQDAMAVIMIEESELIRLLIYEGVILLVACLFILRSFRWQSIYLYFLVALSWFLCFKQAHTAVGYYNVFGFFLFMPPLAILLYLFSAEKYKTWAGRAFVLILAIQIAATQQIRVYMSEDDTFEGYLLTYPPKTIADKMKSNFKPAQLLEIVAIKNPLNYVARFINYNYEDNFKDNPFLLSQDILQKIGTASVDIVPHEIKYLYFNRLNYNPRPVIQSYQANSDWLMKKNGDKYLSKTAPEYVMYHIASFREQNPFWVETDLTKALLQNYKLTDTTLIENDTFFVFQHQALAKKPEVAAVKTITYKINEDIFLPDTDKPILFTANIEYSLKGKLARLLFQPPYLYCEATFENGQAVNYRVIDKILKGGIFISPKVTTQSETAGFFLNEGMSNLKVKKIRFWSKYSSGFKQSFSAQIQPFIIP